MVKKAIQNNDDKILKLKEQIAEKKKLINKSQRFSPITNCSLQLDGERFNLHAVTKDQVIHLLVKLSAYVDKAKEMELIDDYNISGYHIEYWIIDLKAKLDWHNRSAEEIKLRNMETALDRMLSSEKKVELELDNIEAMLNE